MTVDTPASVPGPLLDVAELAKRFTVGGITRDKEYDLTKGTPGSRVLYFAFHKTNEESAAQMLSLIHI